MKAVKSRETIYLSILGFLVIFLFIISEIISSMPNRSHTLNLVLNTFSVSIFLTTIFLLFLSIYFSKRNKKSIIEQEKLMLELEESNKNLQLRVEESTADIEEHSEELEAKANDLEMVLRLMEDEVKNRKMLESEAIHQKTLIEAQIVMEVALSKLNMSLNSNMGINEIAEKSILEICEFLSAHIGSIYLVDENDYLTRRSGYAYYKEVNFSDSFKIGEGIVGQVGKSGKTIITVDTDSNIAVKFGFASLNFLQIIDLPLIYNDNILGVMELGFIKPLAEDKLEWLNKASDIISTVIKLSMDNEELTKLLADIVGKEDLLRNILEASGEGIYGVDINGRVTFINTEACKILGYSAEEIIGEISHEMIHYKRLNGEIYPSEECCICTAKKAGKLIKVNDEVFWCKDGKSIFVEYTANPIFKLEKVIGQVISFRDVSEKKHAEGHLNFINYIMETQVPCFGLTQRLEP